MRSVAISDALPPPPLSVPQSVWHSPVSYLFGGLAVMLGLIAFALLILACSYWKLSAHIYGGGGGGGGSATAAAPKLAVAAAAAASPQPPSSFVVIMAGNDKPTFIAMPMRGRAVDVPMQGGGGGGDEGAVTTPGGRE
ncbi:protein GLUTAMINE DUMPER 3-like [Ananas comosus]|uniref:Protein GLUTAMINE DUMPER 3-like n=1 Tax=Ananas comosus TaxID=4615 RepID=A0A6P5G248_ANACO|nr:protein GLUTAMINE DUMPER 3-like [Ananas comosus]